MALILKKHYSCYFCCLNWKALLPLVQKGEEKIKKYIYLYQLNYILYRLSLHFIILVEQAEKGPRSEAFSIETKNLFYVYNCLKSFLKFYLLIVYKLIHWQFLVAKQSKAALISMPFRA